jgi:hypothetical protein
VGALASNRATYERRAAVGTFRFVILRCTAKLQAVVGRAGADGLAAIPSEDDWYANLVWIEGRKCLLVTHAGTLFSVFVPDVRVRELRPIGGFVVPLILGELTSEGFPVQCLGAMDPAEVVIGPTRNRSVLGCMLDLAWRCEAAAADAGGLSRLDVRQLNHELHRHIVGPGGATLPIERVAQRAG